MNEADFSWILVRPSQINSLPCFLSTFLSLFVLNASSLFCFHSPPFGMSLNQENWLFFSFLNSFKVGLVLACFGNWKDVDCLLSQLLFLEDRPHLRRAIKVAVVVRGVGSGSRYKGRQSEGNWVEVDGGGESLFEAGRATLISLRNLGIVDILSRKCWWLDLVGHLHPWLVFLNFFLVLFLFTYASYLDLCTQGIEQRLEGLYQLEP